MDRTKDRTDLNHWALHLHRYGGRMMCGRPLGAETQNWTDEDHTFNDSDNQCQRCRRSKDRDDEGLMEQARQQTAPVEARP